MLLCHNLNIINPATTVLNFYSKFMITVRPIKWFSRWDTWAIYNYIHTDWKLSLKCLEGPSNLKVSRLTVKCSQWWQQHQLPAVLNCVLCSASALLYDPIPPSLHLSVPECPHLQHWNNCICHLLTVHE